MSEGLLLGLTVALAAKRAGIGYTTYYDWRRRGEAGEAPEYVEFLEATDRALADNAAKCLAVVVKAAKGGTWQAAAWLLERRHGYTAKQEVKQEISGPDGGPISIGVDLTKLTPEQLRALAHDDG